jgi:hypothetical protein
MFAASFAAAQDASDLSAVNEFAITAGRSFVSTQTVPSSGLAVHFGRPATVALNYARLIKGRGIYGLYAELPVAMYPRMGLAYLTNLTPKDIGALFLTPSVRLNIFAGQGLTPWVGVGGGYGRFREAATLTSNLPNPGPRSTNTGVVQFAAGLDTWVWHGWGARLEVRDFYSGAPALNVDTGRSRQHNYYVGVGVIRRF